MIDWKRVDELRREVGNEGFSEVVELFLDEVEQIVLRLRTTPDPSTYEEDLHFLKGSAWNLGFTDFGALCQDGERKAAHGHISAINVSAVLDCYGASKQSFMSGLDQLSEGRSPTAA